MTREKSRENLIRLLVALPVGLIAGGVAMLVSIAAGIPPAWLGFIPASVFAGFAFLVLTSDVGQRGGEDE